MDEGRILDVVRDVEDSLEKENKTINKNDSFVINEELKKTKPKSSGQTKMSDF